MTPFMKRVQCIQRGGESIEMKQGFEKTITIFGGKSMEINQGFETKITIFGGKSMEIREDFSNTGYYKTEFSEAGPILLTFFGFFLTCS